MAARKCECELAPALLMLLTLVLVGPGLGLTQEKGNDEGNKVHRLKVPHSAQQRNVTFKAMGSIFPCLSFAHMYTFINFTKSVHRYNVFVKIFDREIQKTHQTLDSFNITDFNSTLSMLISKLATAYEYVSFVAFLIDSPIKVTKSKYELHLSDPPSLSDYMYLDPTKWGLPREKRQAFLGGLAVATVGLGLFGLFNSHELLYLKNQLANENRKLNLVVSRLEETDSILANQERRIYTIRSTVNSLIAASEATEARVRLDELVVHLSLAMDEIISHSEALTFMLQNKRLHPRFFLQESLTKAFDEVKSSAKSHNLVLVNERAAEVIFEPASYHVYAGEIFFAVHLALHFKQKYSLFRYVNVPIVLQSGQAAKLPSSYDTLLAVNSVLNEHLVLSDLELRDCLAKEKGYICPSMPVRRSLHSSCLGALYLGDSEAMRLHCKYVGLDPYSEIISVIDGQSLVAYAPPHSQLPAYVTCPSTNSSTQLMIVDHEILKLGEDCNIIFPHYLFRSNKQLEIRSTFVSRKLIEIAGFQTSVKRTLPSSIPPFAKNHFHSPLDISSSAASLEIAPWLQILIVTLLTSGVLILGVLLLRARRNRHLRQRRGRVPTLVEKDAEDAANACRAAHGGKEQSQLCAAATSDLLLVNRNLATDVESRRSRWRWRWWPFPKAEPKRDMEREGESERRHSFVLQPSRSASPEPPQEIRGGER